MRSAAKGQAKATSRFLFASDLGDPFSCVYLSDVGCLAGTVQGKVCLYNFESQETEWLSSFSDEGVHGLYMDDCGHFATLIESCRGWGAERPFNEMRRKDL